MSERILEHCPRCGAAGLSRPGVNNVVCPRCKFQLYLNTAAAVCALIQDDRGRLLVTVRANDPKKGFWDLPGGFVDPDESAEQAVIREVREELGLRVSSTHYLCSRPNAYPFGGVTYRTLDLAYVCRVESAQRAVAADDVQGIVYCRPAQLDPHRFGFDSIRQIVEFFFKRTHPL